MRSKSKDSQDYNGSVLIASGFYSMCAEEPLVVLCKRHDLTWVFKGWLMKNGIKYQYAVVTVLVRTDENLN